MKFHPNSLVTIKLEPEKLVIKIGPIINRVKCCFEFYSVVLTETTNNYDYILKTLNTINSTNDSNKSNDSNISNDSNTTEISTCYKKFKELFQIDHVTLLESESITLTNQDLLNDLDFIKDEIIKCKIHMNTLKQKNELNLYNFYNDLVNNRQHEMFQFLSKNDYDNYLDKIAKIIEIEFPKDCENDNIANVQIISEKIWTDEANNLYNIT